VIGRRLASLALLASLAILALLAGGATAQTEYEGPAATAGPEPLWVADPLQETDEAAVPAAELEVAAPVAAGPAADDDPARIAIAHWMAAGAREAGLPGELPVMAALVESGLRNLPYGHADSVGFFQMRLGIWNQGDYAGYLARPELQLRWFVDHAAAVRDAQHAAGNLAFGDDPATWGAWIAAVERPLEIYAGRYQLRLDEARGLLAAPADAIAPFELGLTVGAPGGPEAGATVDALAARVLADPAITLDPRARSDLEAGRVDARVSAVLLEAAARAPISIWVMQTGHSYLTVNGTVSNHSFGRGVDIGSVGGEVVSPTNEAARDLADALGRLPEAIRPTEIGTPWAIDEPGYFTDTGHLDHLHVGFDDPSLLSAADAATQLGTSLVPVARRTAAPPAEPSFEAAREPVRRGERLEPRFEAKP
jgi:hypothetical protein